jgi:hypothetical protein
VGSPGSLTRYPPGKSLPEMMGSEGSATGATNVNAAQPVTVGPGAVRRPAWVAHVLDASADEPHAVLLHLPRGERIALSPTATRVWQLIVAAGPDGVRLDEQVPQLAAEYGADPETIARDVAALRAQLLAGEWIEPVTP